MTALDFARRVVQSRLTEVDGPNRAPLIDAMNRDVGVPPGSPWCASFVSFCFRQAGEREFPFSASSQAIRRWFEGQDWFSNDPQELREWRGALFGWTLPGGAHGHIGFVAEPIVENRRVVAITTLEGNTSSRTRGRNGDGAYSLRRTVPIDGRRRLWFLRTDEVGPTGRGWR